MHSTGYTVRFVVIMTTIVAAALALLSTGWAEQSKLNEAIFNKRAILSAVSDYLGDQDPKDMADSDVLGIFDSQVEQIALDMEGTKLDAAAIQAAGYKGGRPEDIDMAKEKKKPEADRILPLYVFNSDKGKVYILSVRGNGLWDEIWGNIAVDKNMNVVGAAFDHKGETPGLGAEIKDNPAFAKSFKGKKIYNDGGDYVSVDVVKGGAGKNNPYGVDGLTGATVTADGVGEMLYRGIKYYEPYLDEVRK